MRVIAGTLKGRQLKAPAWNGLRPTSDKLRETLFNVLATRLPGARVLDGYAGTGAIGIESISRGARAVVFVERDERARALIEDNLARCGIDSISTEGVRFDKLYNYLAIGEWPKRTDANLLQINAMITKGEKPIYRLLPDAFREN